MSIRDEGLAWRRKLEAEERELESILRESRGPKLVVTGLTPAPEYPVESRGVYVARFLTAKGRHFLRCIDRRGREVARVVVRNPDDWDSAGRVASKALDELDPLPRLVT